MTLSPRAFLALRGAQAIATLALVAYAVQGAIPWCRSHVGATFEDWVYPGLILTAGGFCVARAIRTRVERGAWIAIGTGLVLWAGAELYGTLAGFPSGSFTPADPLWLAFYPASLIGLHRLVRARVRRLHAGLAVDAVIGALGMTAVAAALGFGAILGERAADPQDFPLDVAFFFGDLTLLAATVAVFALTAWRPGRTLATIASGFALCTAVDGFSLWQGATGFDLQITSVFALWPAAALLIGFAGWSAEPRRAVAIAPVEGWRTIAIPSAFAATALAVLIVHVVAPLNALAVSLAAATLAAVIVRMALTLAQHMRLLATSRREALTDALTGLGNRRKLMLDLERASDEAGDRDPWALLLFDLDAFKQYNDWHGHPAGDALLQELGARLERAVGPVATAYRLGGDEFCVILRGGELDARNVRAEALDALLDSAGGFEVSSSCGLVMIPADAGTSAAVLQVADERLYAQKARRRRFSVGRQTSSALVQAIHEREPGLGDHVDEVAALARTLAIELGLEGEELDQVVRAAELHDVGKPAERFDGRGYPDRLMGEEIPIGSRIVAVCDAFNAMTTDRPYRPKVAPEDALYELRRCAGGQFDPLVVEAFARIVDARRLPATDDVPLAPPVQPNVNA